MSDFSKMSYIKNKENYEIIIQYLKSKDFQIFYDQFEENHLLSYKNNHLIQIIITGISGPFINNLDQEGEITLIHKKLNTTIGYLFIDEFPKLEINLPDSVQFSIEPLPISNYEKDLLSLKIISDLLISDKNSIIYQSYKWDFINTTQFKDIENNLHFVISQPFYYGSESIKTTYTFNELLAAINYGLQMTTNIYFYKVSLTSSINPFDPRFKDINEEHFPPLRGQPFIHKIDFYRIELSKTIKFYNFNNELCFELFDNKDYLH